MKKHLGFLAHALAAAVLLLATVGCNEDEITNPSVEETVEAKLAQALRTTVMPLVGFMKTVSGRLTASSTSATIGLHCPDTSNWCSPGSASCYLNNVDGIDRIFTFDECAVAGADRPLTIDGTVSAIPSMGPGLLGELAITNLVVNDSPVISGTGGTLTQECLYVAHVQAGDMEINAAPVICEADTYPTGGDLYLYSSQYWFQILFDGTRSPRVYAQLSSTGETVAQCRINLDTLRPSCVVF